MKTRYLILILVLFGGSIVFAQSTIIIESEASMTVESGADICSDNIVINGTINGDGTRCSSLPLPVELTYFEGTATEEGVVLNWETATEVNNYGFEVQKSEVSSQNSEKNWAQIGFVQGHGTTNSPKQYSFTDPLNLTLNPNLPVPQSGLTRLDYRLKQIDNDGVFAYSKTITVDLSTITSIDDEKIPTVYSLEQNNPNPFNPTTTIKFGLPEAGLVDLRVYNLLGQEVAKLVNKELTAGYHQVIFGNKNLSSGMYIYRINVEGKFNSVKKMLMIK